VCRYRTCILIGNRVIRCAQTGAEWPAQKKEGKRFRGQKDLQAGTKE
jgi:hypothetical protein